MKDKRQKNYKRFSQEERASILDDYLRSEMTVRKYCENAPVCEGTLHRWVREATQKTKKKRQHFSFQERKEAVEQYIKSGMNQRDFSKAWGVDQKTLSKWYGIYKNKGPRGLESGKIYGTGKKRGRKSIKQEIKNKIIETRKSLPEHGLKKLKNFLYRFEGVNVSPNTIKKVLKEESLYEPPQAPPPRKSPPQPRRFERANPMQMWQSDITSYVLKRTGKRVYLVVFKDDHSRYIVAWSLAMKQTGRFVMECYLDGAQKFGKPQEVLTDQGRQYFSWRGKSEFQKMLEDEGVRHVVSRSHHPQTLGKCERFWKTVGIEFWNRAKPEDLQEAKERFAHFVNHYNHFRPHQGLNGMTPADRFFAVESDVKRMIEENLTKNELRLSIDQRPRRPFYFVGQIGEKRVAIHGEKGNLKINTPDGAVERMNYEDFGNGYTESSRTNSKSSGQWDQKNQEETRAQEREFFSSGEASDTYKGPMAGSERGREESCTPASNSDNGILDGHDYERGSSEETGSHASSYMADGSTGRLGDVRRTFEATEDEEEYGEQRGRSEVPKEEDQRIGRDYWDAGEVDRSLERDARVQACDLQTGIGAGEARGGLGEEESYEEESDKEKENDKEENIEHRSEQWQEASEDTTKSSRPEWWRTYLEKKDE